MDETKLAQLLELAREIDPSLPAAIGKMMVFAEEEDSGDPVLWDPLLRDAARRFYPTARTWLTSTEWCDWPGDVQVEWSDPNVEAEPLECRECEAPMFIDDAGVAHHYASGDGDDIDYDMDGDHVAVADVNPDEPTTLDEVPEGWYRVDLFPTPHVWVGPFSSEIEVPPAEHAHQQTLYWVGGGSA